MRQTRAIELGTGLFVLLGFAALFQIFDGVQIIDYTAPYEVFGQAGFDVYTVSPDGGPVTTAMNMHVTPHVSIEDAPRPDLLLVPGGEIGDVMSFSETTVKRETQSIIAKLRSSDRTHAAITAFRLGLIQ